MFQFTQRLGFDLADALAGQRELLADFFQRVVGVHADAEAHTQHALCTSYTRSGLPPSSKRTASTRLNCWRIIYYPVQFAATSSISTGTLARNRRAALPLIAIAIRGYLTS
jgi:hypothetical protein